MKILHLIIDHQVVERTMGIYEDVFPGCNKLVVFDVFNKPLKHIKNIHCHSIVRLGKGDTIGRQFDFQGYTHIVAHFLTMDMIDFIKLAPKDIHVCWEIYGWDLYNQFEKTLNLNLYYTDSRQYEKYSKYYFFQSHFSTMFNYLLKMKGYKYRSEKDKKKQLDFIANRIDSIQACCKDDASVVMDYAKKKLPWFECFNYSLTETLGDLKGIPFFEGSDILIGNSASLSNNHLYVMDKIKDFIFPQGCKIVMPISYGGNPHYKEDVKNAYTAKFGESVEFITEYMPLHEYNKIFLRLKTMILSAWRQESIGTIIMGLYLGIKIFLSDRSPLYKWMNECGFIVKAIETATSESLNTPLSDNEKKHNRDLVLSRYDEQVFAATLIKQFS